MSVVPGIRLLRLVFEFVVACLAANAKRAAEKLRKLSEIGFSGQNAVSLTENAGGRKIAFYDV